MRPDREERIDEVLDRLNRKRSEECGKMQCKVCWYVYDPDQGCEMFEIEPGTAFNDLPDYFTCPNCGSAKTMFIPFYEEDDS